MKSLYSLVDYDSSITKGTIKGSRYFLGYSGYSKGVTFSGLF